MNNKLAAELLGTFVLSLTVLLSVSGAFPIPTPILASLVLFLFVATIGGISGSHINPAVTLGLLSVKKIGKQEAINYMLAQGSGAIAAYILGSIMGINVGGAQATVGSYFFEFVGMTLFTFGIASVVFDPPKIIAPGFIIGGSLLLGISLSVLGGGPGILNPAVAVALQTTTIGYYVVEIIGGIAGFRLYKKIKGIA